MWIEPRCFSNLTPVIKLLPICSSLFCLNQRKNGWEPWNWAIHPSKCKERTWWVRNVCFQKPRSGAEVNVSSSLWCRLSIISQDLELLMGPCQSFPCKLLVTGINYSSVRCWRVKGLGQWSGRSGYCQRQVSTWPTQGAVLRGLFLGKAKERILMSTVWCFGAMKHAWLELEEVTEPDHKNKT